jgi:hypothetical protein
MTQRRLLIVQQKNCSKSAVSDCIDRIAGGRGQRQRVITQPRPVADIAFVSIKLSETAIHSVDENAATNNQDERERRKCL